MKHIVVIISLLLFCFNLITNLDTAEKITTNNFSSLNNKIMTMDPLFIADWQVPEGDIFFQGWVRYYHYISQKHQKRPRLFFQNDKYYHQRINKEKLKLGDKYGDYKIPNKAGFFMVVKNETLSLYSERSVGGYQDGVIDGLNFNFIDHVSKRSPGLYGIKDFGEHVLGSCLEIFVRIPKTYNPVYNKVKQPHYNSFWIICTDKKKDKLKILKTLIKLKVNFQEKHKDPLLIMHDEKERKEDEKRTPKLLSKAQKKDLKSPKDGYWFLLQDWTTCTLRCGGGWSYKHFMCIPPKAGGKPCKGTAIRKKPCNPQPCKFDLNKLLNKPQEKARNTMVKTGHFTKRPQRYSVCQIRENDAFLATYNPAIKSDNKQPVRVLMNRYQISIYKDDSYSDLYYNYEIKSSSVDVSKKTTCCFILKDTYKKTKLCGYPENCKLSSNLHGPIVGIGDQSLLNTPNGWAKSWVKDFQIFRNTCKTGKQAALLTERDLKELPVKGFNEGALISMMKRKLQKQEEEVALKRVKKTTNLGFVAIKKEIDLEKMILNEEALKGKEELDVLKKKIEAEKKKVNCLHNNIEEKGLDDIRENKLEEIRLKEKFQSNIAKRRLRMKSMLENIRRKNKLKRQVMEQELKELKAKISKDLLRANYVGDIKKCIRGKSDMDYRNSYCNQFWVESFDNNRDCHSDDYWCEMCCNHEFGNLYMKKRYECYDICDAKRVTRPGSPNNSKGRWQWAPKYETGGDHMKPKRSHSSS